MRRATRRSTTSAPDGTPSPKRSARCCGHARPARRCASTTTGSSAATAGSCRSPTASAPVQVDGGRGAVVGVPRHLRGAARPGRARARRRAARVARPDRRGRRRRAPAPRPRPPRRRAAAARQRRDRAAARRAAQRRRRPGGRRARPSCASRWTSCATSPPGILPADPHEPRPGRGGRDADRAGRRCRSTASTSRRAATTRRVEVAAYFVVAEALDERRQARRGRRRRAVEVARDGGRARRGDPRRRPRRRRPRRRAAACAGWRIASPRSTARWRWTARRAAGPGSARGCRSLRRAQQREHRHHAPVLVVRVADAELREDAGSRASRRRRR